MVDENPTLTKVMRTMGAAWRALRLYPATSAMPVAAAGAVAAIVGEYLEAEPSLKLDVVRDGFVLRGLEGVLTAPGVADIADALASHGIGELQFVEPPSPEDIIALLSAAQLQQQELQDQRGMQSALSAAGVLSIRVIPVVLQKVEAPPEIPEEEADRFFSELAADAMRLALWLRSLLAFDDEGLIEGLRTLADAAQDLPTFGMTLSDAFFELDQDAKDRLFEAFIELEPLREIAVATLENLSPLEVVSALRGGQFQKSPLALSYAITSLPVTYPVSELKTEVRDALRAADVPDSEVGFLERMIDLRSAGAPEPSLADAKPVYRAMVETSRLAPEQLAAARADGEARARLNVTSAGTLMVLLDAARDLRSYSRVLEALARAVPHLLEIGNPDLAMWVLREYTRRVQHSDKPWPELQDRLARAHEVSCGPESMSALLGLFSADPRAVEYAKELVTLGGDKAASSMATAALASEVEGGMEFAESVLGRRLPELLAPEAPRADGRHAAKLALLFARDAGPWCMQALGQLVVRSEDRVRAETARGIGAAGGEAVVAFLPRLLRDPSKSVVKVTIAVLGRMGDAGAMAMLAQRLLEIDSDKDIGVAREIIAVLASSPVPLAGTALEEAAGKGSFMRKGRVAEMRQAAQEALVSRKARGL